MTILDVAFWVLAVLTGASSIGVVAARNVVHAALFLAAALLGAAGIFLLFGAEFIGLAQILINVGAVMVLFLFGIMLTAARGSTVVDNTQRPLAAVVAIGVFIVLAAGIIGAFGGERLELDVAFPTAEIGRELFSVWILPFEAIALLLLAAVVGAIVLARRD